MATSCHEGIDPEQVAYWYFRLQGCLTITNFMLHRFDSGGRGRAYSDGDMIAVRFPHRQESTMQREETFFSSEKIDLCLVEVKFRNAPPEINNTWRNGTTVLRETLLRVGLFPEERVDEIITGNWLNGWNFEDDTYRVRVVTVSRSAVETRTEEMPLPRSQQLTWDNDILPFIFQRFGKYGRYKTYHPQWADEGKSLFDWVSENYGNQDGFLRKVKTEMQRFVAQRNSTQKGV